MKKYFVVFCAAVMFLLCLPMYAGAMMEPETSFEVYPGDDSLMHIEFSGTVGREVRRVEVLVENKSLGYVIPTSELNRSNIILDTAELEKPDIKVFTGKLKIKKKGSYIIALKYWYRQDGINYSFSRELTRRVADNMNFEIDDIRYDADGNLQIIYFGYPLFGYVPAQGQNLVNIQIGNVAVDSIIECQGNDCAVGITAGREYYKNYMQNVIMDTFFYNKMWPYRYHSETVYPDMGL